MRQNAGSVAGN